ncbi:MAG: type II toxin-antitoxin system HicA family toxin [Bacteroidales bacterium]
MKYNELHRLILRNGWIIIRQTGSHVIYEKNGMHYPVPNHGSDEVKKGLEIKVKKMMGLQ